jgi:tetratricopeptide (TPR) repeat protein
LRIAKKLYRDAISTLDEKSGSFASQIWVNYGNCLSQFGRYVEAIESYEKALDADPTNGMAAGNLGVELEHATRIIGRHRHEYIALAHDYLTRALGSGMHLNFGSPDAAQDFQAALERLQHFINAHREPILPPQPAEAVARSHAQKDNIQFCIENGLFLNAWVGNKELSPGITDDVYFGPIVTSVGDNYLVPELLRILNEIKESFATARYLYYLSQKQNNVLDAISKMTVYYGTDTFAINGLYTGLCKVAYARAFDVLDKVARIINVYFKIGKREDSFWEVFAEKQSLGEAHTIRFVARPAICKTENHGLYALADLCIDYFESEHADLKAIDTRRNWITHDYLNVKLHATDAELEETGTVDLDGLQDQTRHVLHLGKVAILYAVSAINMAERRKDDATKRRFELEYSGTPGQPFL